MSDRGALSNREGEITASSLRDTFLLLPEDVFPQICEWLSVREIFILRLVNKNIGGLTKNSSIWLSLLRRLTLAIPPGQPVLPDSFGYYPLHSLESFVSRALRLEQSWREYNPLASHYRFNGHQRILLMRFLPGGKYMVSVSQNTESTSESIVVWDMNYCGRRNHVAITMLNSETAVHKLQVRYATASGKLSLVVAFTRPPVDGRTVIIVIYVTVELLENLSRLGPGSAAFMEYSRLVPNPFTKLLETRTRYPVGALSLSDIDGRPILAVVNRPRTINFYFLDSGERACLKLTSVPGHDTWRHSIWDIKILSSQKQILVIRVLIGEVGAPDTNPLVFEIYDMPLESVEMEDVIPSNKTLVKDHRIDGFYVSDAEASWWSKTHIDPHTPMLHKLSNGPPPPISIFVTTREPRGFLHFLMLPEVPPSIARAEAAGDPCCVYKLPTSTHALFEWDENEQAVIVAGAYRSIVWMRSASRQPMKGIAVLRLAVYRTEGYTFSDSRDTGHSSSGPMNKIASNPDAESMDVDEFDERYISSDLVGQPAENPKNRAMKYPVVPEDVAQAMRGGMHCLQFDEWLGRLCVATTQDKWIHVLDWSI